MQLHDGQIKAIARLSNGSDRTTHQADDVPLGFTCRE